MEHGCFNFPSPNPLLFCMLHPVTEPVELVQEPAWSSNREYYGHHARTGIIHRDYRRLRSSTSGSSGSIKEGPKKQR